MDVKYDAEKLQKDTDQFIEKFRLRMKDVVDEVFGQAYVDVLPHIETDAWTNYREYLRSELEHEYKFSRFKEPWAINFRRAVFVENREEISKLISGDILKRIKELEDIKQEYDQFRYSPGGDRYQDKVKEADSLRKMAESYRRLLAELLGFVERPPQLSTGDKAWDMDRCIKEARAALESK